MAKKKHMTASINLKQAGKKTVLFKVLRWDLYNSGDSIAWIRRHDDEKERNEVGDYVKYR